VSTQWFLSNNRAVLIVLIVLIVLVVLIAFNSRWCGIRHDSLISDFADFALDQAFNADFHQQFYPPQLSIHHNEFTDWHILIEICWIFIDFHITPTNIYWYQLQNHCHSDNHVVGPSRRICCSRHQYYSDIYLHIKSIIVDDEHYDLVRLRLLEADMLIVEHVILDANWLHRRDLRLCHKECASLFIVYISSVL